TREHAIEFPPDFLQRLREEHVQAFQRELRAIPGMSSLFRRLRIPKSMVSNGSVRHVERSLRRVRLRHALDGHIFSAEHVQRPKPHPDVYQLALDTLRLQPHDVLVVEDSPTGVAAAKSAGLRVVGFLGAAHVFDGHGEKLLSHGADWLANDARSLGRILAEHGAV
ncbi:MAG TPA: HAD-IA family hydrolase, partial [Saprospiraceae bacterium]|nr:HAD-IA family hydrolase [Saprospiraceae bacterium]